MKMLTELNRRRWAVRLVLVAGLALPILAVLPRGLQGVTPARAHPGTLYVDKATGSDDSDCSNPATPCATISYAVGQATDGDTVLIAAGTYTENVTYDSKTLTIRGGHTTSGTTWLSGTGETVVDGNDADRVFFIHGNDSVLEDLTIVNGHAPDGEPWGGGIWVTNGSFKLLRTVVMSNVNGGVEVNSDFGPTHLTLEQSVIANNSGNPGGLNVSESEASALVVNTLIFGNSGDPGGIRLGSGNMMAGELGVVNSTIADNTGSAGIRIEAGGTFNLTNGIVWGNSGDNLVCYATCTVTYSDIETAGVHTGTGNINANPLFADPLNGDYHLSAGSPCVDAGTDIGAPGHDLDGMPRPLDGNDDGTAVTDMGAYELYGAPPQCTSGNGVDDLRGRWEFVVTEAFDEPLAFELTINDLAPDPVSSTGRDYLATGCMASPGVDGVAPLLLRATDQCNGSFGLSLLSTAAPPPGEGEPFVIQFLGTVVTHGSGIPDDEAGGPVRTDFAEGAWTGIHHDRRRTKCPIGDPPIPGLYFGADVYVHHGYWGAEIVHSSTLLEAYTNIVSLGMRVEWPDGTVVVVPFYTDIFSPHVDFVSQFRYLEGYSGDAISGQAYTFTLLDGLGNPIPGTTAADVWTGCQIYPPPRDLTAVLSGNDIDLSWAPVPDTPGFDPDGGSGFYQIGSWPQFDSGTNYGANSIMSSNHVIPWDRHDRWDEWGSPDGADHGNALREFDDGLYQLQVEAFSYPDPGNPQAGQGLECAVWDGAENLFFEKTGDGITFVTLGSISGTVCDVRGDPLADVAVDIEEGGFGTCTDGGGTYTMWGLPLGTFNVIAGLQFCTEHPYIEQTEFGITLSEDAPHVEGIDFTLPDPL
jgi:hypothetical protein